jgi:hypothetical protein
MRDETNENGSIGVSDLPLVAALLCHGAKIASVERNNGPRATFYIAQEKGLNELVEAFYTHTLRVDPWAYFNCLKEAKNHLYARTISI